MVGGRRPTPQGRLSIDRASPVPLHVQLKQALRDQILSGAWTAGDLVPGEPELCREFRVSRTTVRQALAALAFEGLVTRERGRGTFVALPKLTERAAERLSGFYEDMAVLGYPPVSRVLKQEIVHADEQVAARLNLRPGARVVEIERLRLVHEEPVVLTTTRLPTKLCPGLETADLTHRSLYEYLETELGYRLARGRRTIEAVAADARQARLLRTRKGAPLAFLESVSYLDDGRPIEYYLAWHRGDRSRFEVELFRSRERGREAPLPADRLRRLPPGSGSLRRGGRK
jgi:GntR family transcriptional regulator